MTAARRLLVALALCLGVASVVAGLAVAVVGFAPIPYGDSLSFFRKFFDAGGWQGYGLAELVSLHNEHRIIIPNLWFLADIWLFSATQVSLIAGVVVSALAHAALLSWIFRRLGHERAAFWIFSAVAVGAALSPAAWENLVWGFQVQFIQVWLFATLAFVALAVGDIRRRWGRTFAAMALGLASTYSMANGLLVWPLLAALALWRGVGRGPALLLAAVGVAVLVGEVFGFRPHPKHSNPLESVQHPLAVAHYALRYLTSGVAAIGPLARDLLGVGLVGSVAIIAADALLHRQRYRAEHGVLLAVAGFAVGAALLTALGRVGFGLWQADASRYATPSLLFILACLGLLMDRAAATRRADGAPLIGAAGSLLLIPGLLIPLADLPAIAGSRDSRINAIVSHLAGGYRPSTLAALFPIPSTVPPRMLNQLDRNDLGPFAVRRRFMPPPDALAGPVTIPQEACRGHVDGVASDPVNGLVVWGWATAAGSTEAPRWVLAVGADGAVLAWGGSLIWRPDVAQALESRWGGRGFSATGPAPAEGAVSVVGLFADGRRCRIATGVRPRPPRFLAALPDRARPASAGDWTVTEGSAPRSLGSGEPPPAVLPAVGSVGLRSSRFAAHLDIAAGDVPVDLLVPVRTGPYPVAVRIAVVDAGTGDEVEAHDFGRPSTDGWSWLVFRGTRDAAGQRLRLRASASGEGRWQGVAVGRPYWLPVAPGG